jgi:3-oxoacid CoA-transferase
MRSKPVVSLQEAAALVEAGDTILVGGFGMTGTPTHLLHALAETEVHGLTYIGNNVGEVGLGGGRLLRNGQLKKAIGSYFTSNPEVVAAATSGDLEVELIPQGSLGEALRAGGAGLGGFFTPTGVGTQLYAESELRVIGGKEMVFVRAIRGNVALIRAWKADAAGNLQYRMTENNFNQAAATAADIVIAEVEEIVPIGDIPPEFVHTQALYVDYLVRAKLRPEDLGISMSISSGHKKVDKSRLAMVSVALDFLRHGDIVNLGIGIPTLIADLLSFDHGVTLHTENGMLGVGPRPNRGGAMRFPVNAGKTPVTAVSGCSYFDSASSFGMIRGGHIDVAIMGGLQVDQYGNLANWSAPGKPVLGVGGAMDLASGARKLIIVMTHVNHAGHSKVVKKCDLPLTANNVVDVLITDLAVFQFKQKKMTLIQLMPGSSVAAVASATLAEYEVALETTRN